MSATTRLTNYSRRAVQAQKVTRATRVVRKAAPVAKKAIQRSTKVVNLTKSMSNWLGRGTRVLTNRAGDKVFISRDGLRKVRFDIKNIHHDGPHAHLEIFRNGKWRPAVNGIKQIYPKT